MNIRECNSRANCVYIDKSCFVIHILYGWLVIFISFLVDNFFIQFDNILRFLIDSFIHSYTLSLFSPGSLYRDDILYAAYAALT